MKSSMIREVHYPWTEIMSLPECTELTLFVYGSLLDRDKLAQYGLKAAYDSAELGLLPRWRRVADLMQSDGAGPYFRLKHTGQPEDCVNGLIIRLTIEELQYLSVEEEGYNLALVKIDCTGVTHITAWTFWGSDTHSTGDALPASEYLERCKSAAAAIGGEFLDLFIMNSFRSDGSRRVWT